jgi:hypothetical protein
MIYIFLFYSNDINRYYGWLGKPIVSNNDRDCVFEEIQQSLCHREEGV